MIALAVVVLVLVLFVVWRRRRKTAQVAPGPLAGYDTGVRSPFRTPGSKWLGPRRGF